VAGEPGAERRGLVRIVFAELIDEGAGEDRAVAAVRAFNGAAFDVGLAARAVPVLADRPTPAIAAVGLAGLWPTQAMLVFTSLGTPAD